MKALKKKKIFILYKPANLWSKLGFINHRLITQENVTAYVECGWPFLLVITNEKKLAYY